MPFLAAHQDQYYDSIRIGGTLNKLKELGLLTDPQVVAMTTEATFLAQLETNFASGLVHEDTRFGLKDQAIAAVKAAFDLGIFTTGILTAATSIANLVTNTDSTATNKKTWRD